MFRQSQFIRHILQDLLGAGEFFFRSDDFHFHKAAQLLYLIQTDFQIEAAALQLIADALLADDGRPLIAETDQEAAKILGRGGAVGQADLDLGPRLGRPWLPGALVSDPVLCADPPHAQRLVGLGKISVRSLEIMVRLLQGRFRTCAPGTKLLLDCLKVRRGEFHLNFQHMCPRSHFISPANPLES